LGFQPYLATKATRVRRIVLIVNYKVAYWDEKINLAAHFAKRNTKKYGGAEKRAGKNSLPLNPFLFARPLFLGVRGGFAP